MPREKRQTKSPQERILDAALQEFSARSFDLASTNTIAKQAKVAKGLLFHYFTNKEELYLAVASRALSNNIALLQSRAVDTPRDLFARIQYWSALRLQIARENPAMYHFLTMMVSECPPALKPKVATLIAPTQKWGLEELMHDLDISRLRPGVSLQQAIEALMLFSSGLERKLIAIFSSTPDHGLSILEQITKESLALMSLLRDGIYLPATKQE